MQKNGGVSYFQIADCLLSTARPIKPGHVYPDAESAIRDNTNSTGDSLGAAYSDRALLFDLARSLRSIDASMKKLVKQTAKPSRKKANRVR